MIEKGICDKWFNWNPSNCQCECDKSCDVGEHLDYRNCNSRERLVEKLVEECSENTDKKNLRPNKMIFYNSTLNDYEKLCSFCERCSCAIYIVLFVIFLLLYCYLLFFIL